MRHAKSSWAEAGQRDHERPLNARGRRDSPAMARQVVESGWMPERALVSDAARTEETWAWMAAEFDAQLILDPRLYHGAIEDLRAVVVDHAGDAQTVLVLGHNPGWEDAVHVLSGRRVGMKTANVALLEHPERLSVAIHRDDWSLRGFLTPR